MRSMSTLLRSEKLAFLETVVEVVLRENMLTTEGPCQRRTLSPQQCVPSVFDCLVLRAEACHVRIGPSVEARQAEYENCRSMSCSERANGQARQPHLAPTRLQFTLILRDNRAVHTDLFQLTFARQES